MFAFDCSTFAFDLAPLLLTMQRKGKRRKGKRRKGKRGALFLCYLCFWRLLPLLLAMLAKAKGKGKRQRQKSPNATFAFPLLLTSLCFLLPFAFDLAPLLLTMLAKAKDAKAKGNRKGKRQRKGKRTEPLLF